MRIIISPAKRMFPEADILPPESVPSMIEKTAVILERLKVMNSGELKKLLGVSDGEKYFNLYHSASVGALSSLTASSPAILAFNGIQYKYMSPQVFSADQMDYVREKLFILSGFYGALRCFDGVISYRLEMQAKLGVNRCGDLYEYWGNSIYRQVSDECGIILDLASEEYSRTVSAYISNERLVRCIFADMENGRLIQKGVHVKMARGAMVRYMAENKIELPEDVRGFDHLGYTYKADLSEKDVYVFVRRT